MDIIVSKDYAVFLAFSRRAFSAKALKKKSSIEVFCHSSCPGSSSASSNNRAPMYLSSVIFTPAGPEATVQEIRRKIHEWVEQATWEVKITNRDNPTGAALQYPPRLLSLETVEISLKDFTEEEIREETENTFEFNRIGTTNSFLFMAFRVYFDVGYLGKHTRSRCISSAVLSHRGHKGPSNCYIN